MGLSLLDAVSDKEAILLLVALILLLAVWAYIDRDTTIKESDAELDEVRRHEAEHNEEP